MRSHEMRRVRHVGRKRPRAAFALEPTNAAAIAGPRRSFRGSPYRPLVTRTDEAAKPHRYLEYGDRMVRALGLVADYGKPETMRNRRWLVSTIFTSLARKRLCWMFTALVVAFGVSAAWASAEAMACPTLQFIGVRGSGEHSGFGHTVGSVLSHINASKQLSAVGNETVDYWAVDVNVWEPKYFPNYMSSVKQGLTNLGDAITDFRKRCGSSPMVLAGYSQGAEVIDHWLNSGADRKNVVGVALLGDPRFNPDNGTTIDQGTYNKHLYGVSYTFFPPIGMFGGVEHYPSGYGTWLRSYCADHDQICNTSSLAALVGCTDSNCAHYHYAEAKLNGGTYTEDAAAFLIARWRSTVRTSAPAGGSPTGSAPTRGGTSSGSPTSGSGSAPGLPAGSVAETVGGVTHTWTNYTNAGGAQGPSIQTGQTVGVACKVEGFTVADGDTWWYQIASAPWNGAYYASADAFYNTGETSGSLSGTPFEDPNVPVCAGSSQPTTGPGSLAETVGGVTHTWTDYTSAGGTQGPSIQTGQTIAVACKVQGFTVADGDTWWYQIASAPWNGAYYASADAFYNNGQTSGSLIGTPFVDPNVPDCGGSSPLPPPPTYAETVGGVTHTWTNYTNAGGTQGPSIQTSQTVQIACKVQGFTVADGDTWWYQIASAPWNGAYYASADAFYNNGQTSGSLIGTPFVDPNVPNC